MKRFTLLLVSLWISLSSVIALGKSVVDRTVVTVNSEVILESDIDNFRKKLKSKSYQELLGIEEKTVKDRETVLTLLVEEKIIDQQVKKLDLKASEQEVEGQIRAIVKRNGITRAQLAERLKQLGTSMDDYRDGLRRQIERRSLVDREIKPSFEVTEEQLRHFYLRNAQPEGADTVYKIAHILVEVKPGAVDRAKKIWSEASKNPAEFEKLAKESSDDTSTAENGGVLGFYSPSQLSKEFREVVPKIPVGSVSKPIRTGAGFHILKILESKAADFSTLTKEQKEALKNQMLSQELQSKMVLWMERKRAEAHIQRFNREKRVNE